MTATAMVEQTCPVGVDLLSSVTEALANQAHRWSDECQRFLDWQRRYVLDADPSTEVCSRHETALGRLLAVGRMLNGATSDPEFRDRRAAELVKARLAQLQESWEMTHTTMSAESGETFLKTHFKHPQS